jgi:hypothetical protein
MMFPRFAKNFYRFMLKPALNTIGGRIASKNTPGLN